MKTTRSLLIAATCGILFALPFAGDAVVYTINTTTADAFLSGASPTLNFGGAGTLAIAPASSPKGEFDSVIMFNTAGAVSQFNTSYGAGNRAITGFTLSLASNFGTNGAIPNNGLLNTVSSGNFGIDWLAYDSWVEGTGEATARPTGPSISIRFPPCSRPAPTRLAPTSTRRRATTFTPVIRCHSMPTSCPTPRREARFHFIFTRRTLGLAICLIPGNSHPTTPS